MILGHPKEGLKRLEGLTKAPKATIDWEVRKNMTTNSKKNMYYVYLIKAQAKK